MLKFHKFRGYWLIHEIKVPEKISIKEYNTINSCNMGTIVLPDCAPKS